MSKHLLKLFFLVITFAITQVSIAQIYNYTNNITGIPASVDPNATGTNLARVNGVQVVVSCVDGFNSRNFSTLATYAPGLTAIQWTITPNAGYEVNVGSMSTRQKRTAAGPQLTRLAYSLDGSTWIDQGFNQTVPTASCGATTILAWNMPDFTSATTVYFRAYGFMASTTGGEQQMTNVTVSGSVTPIVILGCTDPSACNFNPAANTDDGSCSYPGCTSPVACNYNPGAGCDDGSCFSPSDPCDDGDPFTVGDFIQGDCNCLGFNLNDDPSGAVLLDLDSLGSACSPVTGNLSLATTSPESMSPAVTGEDLWYSFVAYTDAVSLEVNSGSFDGILELHDISNNHLETENVRVGTGNEIMNFDGLTEGATYLLAVRNYDSGDGTGFFDLCMRFVADSYVENLQASYNPCANLKARFVGAYSSTFTFISQTNLSVGTYIRVGNTVIQPRNLSNMTWNDTFDVDVDPTYHLFDALGNMEVIQVTTDSYDEVVIPSQPTMTLRPQDQCSSGPNPMGSIVAAEPFVCLTIDYEWEFTRTDIPQAPFTHIRGAANRFLVLNSVTGLVGGATYDVRIRPIFPYGIGNYGPATCMSLLTTSSMILDDQFEEDYAAMLAEEMNYEEPASLSFSEHVKGENFVSLQPNPCACQSFIVKATDFPKETPAVISVKDMSGKIVYQGQYNSGEYLIANIDVGQKLASGLYVVTVVADGYTQTERLIVNE